MTAWPRLMPPSLHGTREWVRTVNPRDSRRVTTWFSSSMFWNTPPDRATVVTALRSRMRRQAAAPTRAPPFGERGGGGPDGGHAVGEAGGDDGGRDARREVAGRGADQVRAADVERAASLRGRAGDRF